MIPTHTHAGCAGFGDAIFVVNLHSSWRSGIAATYRILSQSPFPTPSPDHYDVSRMHPFEQKSDPLPIYKDESRLQEGDLAPAHANPDEPAIATDKAQLEDRNDVAPTNESSDLKDAKQNLSYLAYYAYSEVPPDTKPADTVLKSLEDIPRGTPVEEIKRVADAFGLVADMKLGNSSTPPPL